MQMKILLALAMCLTVVYARDRKRCFCKAVDANNSDKVLKDFGTINEHSHWLSVGCKRLDRCSENCARRVSDWLCQNTNECMAAANGNQVRHHYTASVCSKGSGTVPRSCGCSGGKFDDLHKCQFKCFSSGNVMSFITCFNKCFSGTGAAPGAAAI